MGGKITPTDVTGRGDLDGDGAGEIVTGPGRDRKNKATVRIFKEDGTLLREFQAYPDGLRYGGRVAVGGVGEP
jgi:aspartyl/asparaginyl-tRNA synthetase